MPKFTIEVKGIGKKYIIPHGNTHSYYFRDVFDEAIARPLQFFNRKILRKGREEFWALRNISFSVKKGEILGIIGENGSGKSTLLKILSRITPPTTGKALIKGRLASLLEVGSGFNPELTGRENVFLNGAILGMKRSEIENQFEEIIDFAGEKVKKFVDTPLKRYSSGMQARLAFAVAANLNPDILLLDEVLAVGDAKFCKKSLKKMEEVSLKSGRTVVFVSHDLGSIGKLCNKCILLDKGKMKAYGPTKQVIDEYLQTDSGETVEGTVFKQKRDIAKDINLRKVIINPHLKENARVVPYNEDIKIQIEYEVNRPISNYYLWAGVQTMQGGIIFASADCDKDPDVIKNRGKGYYITKLNIPRYWLSLGEYNLVIGLDRINKEEAKGYDEADIENIEKIETPGFRITEVKKLTKDMVQTSTHLGTLKPTLDWETNKVDNGENLNNV